MANIYYPLFETGIEANVVGLHLVGGKGGGTIPRRKIKCYVRASICFLDQRRWQFDSVNSLHFDALIGAGSFGFVVLKLFGRSIQQF